MARLSLAPLIGHIRDFCACTADEFSDDHLQTALETHATVITRHPIYPIGTFSAGAMVYTRYPIGPQARWVEGAGIGSLWHLADGTNTPAPPHTLADDGRSVLFDDPTDGRTFYLTAHRYDLHRTAADIWMQKAANSAKRVNFSVDGQSVSASDYHTHCLQMATYFQTIGGATLTRRIRTDEV